MWLRRRLLPKSIAHTGNHGAINNYVMEGARLRPAQDAGVFQRPPDPPLPTGTSFDPSLPPEVKAWRSGSGHTVVEPLVNGRSVGYFMLDTGAFCSFTKLRLTPARWIHQLF